MKPRRLGKLYVVQEFIEDGNLCWMSLLADLKTILIIDHDWSTGEKVIYCEHRDFRLVPYGEVTPAYKISFDRSMNITFKEVSR